MAKKKRWIDNTFAFEPKEATKPFMTPVHDHVQMINMDALVGCSVGLARRLRKKCTPDERHRMKIIKKEIDFLINSL